jgi:hypothetical protein
METPEESNKAFKREAEGEAKEMGERGAEEEEEEEEESCSF